MHNTLNPVLLRELHGALIDIVSVMNRPQRDEVIAELRKRGIGCRNYFPPIHLQPLYRRLFGYRAGDFPVTEHVSDRTIALPFFNRLTEEEIGYVCTQLRKAVQSISLHTSLRTSGSLQTIP